MSSIKLSEKQTIAISLRLFKATISINVARFGKMNPYASIVCGSKTYRSSTAKNADCYPEWNENFEMEVRVDSVLEITLYHSAYIIGDVLIGSCSLTSDMLKKGLVQESLPISSTHSHAGTLLLSCVVEEEKASDLNTNNMLEMMDEREDLLSKLAELDLQREELYFYKRKYKQKIHKYGEEKSVIKKHHKQAVYNSMSRSPSPSDSFNNFEMEELNLEREFLAKEKAELRLLRERVEQDVSLLKKQKQKLAVYTKLIQNHCPTLCECSQRIDSARKKILKQVLSESDNLPYTGMKIPSIRDTTQESSIELDSWRRNSDTLALTAPRSPREVKMTSDGIASVLQ
jgi:hypothetical protein